MGAAALWPALALLAAGPVVEKGEDSRIEAWVDLAASPAQVFAVVSDPGQVAKIDGSTRIDTTPDGECYQVTTHVDNVFAKTAYHTRSCPDGPLAVRQTLVGDGPLKEYQTRWWVEPQGAGSRLHYSIRTIPNLPIPQLIVSQTVASSAEHMLTRLEAHFGAAAEAPPPSGAPSP